MDSARHVIGYQFTQEPRVQNAFDDVEITIHQSIKGLMDSAHHVIGRNLTEGTRVPNSFDDVAMDSARHVVGCHSRFN